MNAETLDLMLQRELPAAARGDQNAYGRIVRACQNTVTAIALAIIMIGFFTMIARKKAVTQMVGFLVMENGVFLGATAAAYGMPLIVELGVFFDVLVAGLIAGIYTHRLQDAFDSVDTSELTVLKE